MRNSIISSLIALQVVLFIPSASADNFSYDDKSQIVVSEINFSTTSINTKENDEPVTINVRAYDTFNPFQIAVAQFYSEKGGYSGFAEAMPARSTLTNGVNTEDFVVNMTIPKSLPEGILYLILRFDADKPDNTPWQSTLYGPVEYVPAAQSFPSNLSSTIINSYTAVSVGAQKAAADKAAESAATNAAASAATADATQIADLTSQLTAAKAAAASAATTATNQIADLTSQLTAAKATTTTATNQIADLTSQLNSETTQLAPLKSSVAKLNSMVASQAKQLRTICSNKPKPRGC